MKLGETFTEYDLQDLKQPGVTRDYANFRGKTERDFGLQQADDIEHVVASVHEILLACIVHKADSSRIVALLSSRGWFAPEEQAQVAAFDLCHKLAARPASAARHEVSQFSGALFLQSLNDKYFDQVPQRTTLLAHPRLPDACIAVSALGDPPDTQIAGGIKVILPASADALLWWCFSQSLLVTHFARPADLGSKQWSVDLPDRVDTRIRPWARTIAGQSIHAAGTHRREEVFVSAAYTASYQDRHETRPLIPAEGTYIAYHRLS